MRELQLSNTDNWELIYNENTSAVILPKVGGGFMSVPIPEIPIPILLNTFVLAVKVSTNIPPNRVWKFAGYLKQSVSTGIAIEGNQDAVFSQRQRLFLERINLIIYQRISNSYSISIVVPTWFQDAAIAIWLYTGVDYDSDLARIEAKIDAL